MSLFRLMAGGQLVRGGIVLCASGIVREDRVSLCVAYSFRYSLVCFHLGTMGKFIATLRGHVAPVYRLAWSADSRMVVSASKDHTVKVRPVSRIHSIRVNRLRSGTSKPINSKTISRDIPTKCIASISLLTRLSVEGEIGR